jgi:hypothetical protein
MKRSRAFVHTAIKAHRERMLASFARARKHTNQFIKENHQSAKDNIFLHGKDFFEKGVRIAKKIYFNTVVWIGRLFTKNDRNVLLAKNYWKHIKDSLFYTSKRYFVRAEYTRRDFVVFFFIAFLFGMGIKSFAIQNFTIGFEDYKLAPKESLYDMNVVQQKVVERGSSALKDDPRKGGTCSESLTSN